MIASLRGRVAGRGPDHVILEVGGVGYKVYVPRQPVNGEAYLRIHQVIREDGQWLYGFESQEELTLFEMIIGVSGVGPKAALALLAVSTPSDVAAAIASEDLATLAKAPGVGKKTAERLVVELRGKVSGIAGTSAGRALPPADQAEAALLTLGFTATEASAALRGTVGTLEERVSAALRGVRAG